MRLSIPYVLQGLALGMGISLLLFAVPTAYAQTTIPDPETAIENIADTAQNLGALGFAVVCLGIALVILIVAILVFFWKFASPLLTAWTASNKAAQEAAAEAREAREDQQEASSTHLEITDKRERETQALRTRQAEAMESLGKSMERMAETMSQNDERLENERKTAVTDINKHTDEVFADAKEKLEQAATHVEAAAKTIGDVVTKEHLTAELEPIREELHDIAVTLRKKGDTEELDASKVPASDPAALHAGDTVTLQAPSVETKEETE